MTSRTVLVTGGARGIGAACARTFLEAGHRVAVTSRHGPHGPEPGGLLHLTADVTDRDALDAAFDRIEAELGPVEILVANAGVTADGLALRMSDEEFAGVLDVNLTGAFRAARRALPRMIRARWGRIVFIGSVVGTTGQAGQANYAASKAGLVGLGRSLAREVASRRVTVNVVSPGPIDTDMLAALDDERRAAIAAAVPLGRVGTPAEVAAAVRFLASDEAGFITGAVLPVDGGLAMGPW
jgi:NAD(P)-dependent dehydrogenase (short-subunit alcohol dehydrogenase family)